MENSNAFRQILSIWKQLLRAHDLSSCIKSLEAYSNPTIFQVLPSFQISKKNLRLVSNGVRKGPHITTVDDAAQTLETATLDALDKIMILIYGQRIV